MDIIDIVVDPKYRNKGIGKQMLRIFEKLPEKIIANIFALNLAMIAPKSQ